MPLRSADPDPRQQLPLLRAFPGHSCCDDGAVVVVPLALARRTPRVDKHIPVGFRVETRGTMPTTMNTMDSGRTEKIKNNSRKKRWMELRGLRSLSPHQTEREARFR